MPELNDDRDKKKDDEISIDFSKIKEFFKRGKKKEQQSTLSSISEGSRHSEPKSSESEEISIDFSKIKSFFSKKKQTTLHTSTASHKSEEDINVDWSSVGVFFKKYGVIFLALIPIILSIYIRMQSDYLPFADDWARNNFMSELRNNVHNQISQQYPNLPDNLKNSQVEAEIQKILKDKESGQQINERIRLTAKYIRDFFRDNEGRNYVPDIDPYYWYRYSKNILETGHPGDEVRDGVEYDNHQLAPLGRPVAGDLYHSYFLAYFHKAVSILSPGIPLTRSMSYYPVVVSALCVLLAFLIGRKISGNAGGFFSALMLGALGAFAGRTLFGHADSDAWVVFFPLLITYFFMDSFESNKIIKNVLFAVLAGFFTGVFSISWGGWWYIFDFLMVSAGITFAYLYISKIMKGAHISAPFYDKKIQAVLLTAIIFFVSTALFITLFQDSTRFIQGFYGPLGFSNIKAPVGQSLWPNVLTTVAELNEGSYQQVIQAMGGSGSAGKAMWYISILGILLIFLKKDEDGNRNLKYSALIALWLISSSYASTLGVRFMLLVAPAFSLGFGAALGIIYYYLVKIMHKELHIHKAISSSILILLFLLLYINPVKSSLGPAKNDFPLVNDAWYDSLMAIKNNSTENAIITSWWDFGHHFKAIADRPVTFDGTTQTSDAAHWVGRLLTTSDEKEAYGILRMLDCGSESGFDNIMKITGDDVHKSIKILRETLLLNREDARQKLLSSGLSEEQADKQLSFTHCVQPPEAFFIASDDMIDKSGVWGHFGAWNFERADIWYNTQKLNREKSVDYIMTKFNYSTQYAESTYSQINEIRTKYRKEPLRIEREGNAWIAPYPGLDKKGISGCGRDNENDTSVKCSNGLIVNLTTHEVYANTPDGGIAHPSVFAYLDGDEMKLKKYENPQFNVGVTLMEKSENNFEIVMSSPEMAGGMFIRMFHLKGKGLKYFKPLSFKEGLGTAVYVYKVDWNAQ